MNTETKICQNCKAQFTIDAADFAFYEKMHVPAPTWCPECRLVRRLALRNERALYRRVCDLCKKEKIMMFYPASPFVVYCHPCWVSDGWDAKRYARDYDFSRPFFEQLGELLRAVPRPGILQQGNNVDSEYANRVSENRNTYLIFGSTATENCLYGSWVNDSKECVDNYNVAKSERCYECVDCVGCYNLKYSRECTGCSSSYFLLDCRNCESCFGCVNLRNKSYCVFNTQYSKEAYREFIAQSGIESALALQNFRAKFLAESARHIVPSMVTHHSVGVSGNWLEECKNTQSAFNCRNVEDGKYIFALVQAKDIMDYTHFGRGAERIYDSVNIGRQCSSVLFSNECWEQSTDLQYSMNCLNVQHAFGCVGIRNTQYCILNKQYSRESFEALKAKIIAHMNDMPYTDRKGRVYRYGEFYPPDIMPFAYNETIAQEYFPLTKEQVLERGYAWKEPEPRNYAITLQPHQIPDTIRVVADSITQEIISCEHAVSPSTGSGQPATTAGCNDQCTTAFKIVPNELQFYRQLNLPLPHFCPNCRHYARLRQRNPLKLWKRRCMCAGSTATNPSISFEDTQDKSLGAGDSRLTTYNNTASHFHGTSPCPNEFETSYAPDRSEIVYCEQCYNSEVV